MTDQFKPNIIEKRECVVEVMDAIMGSGKSRAIIAWMNNNPAQRYLYVSPMLSEVEERIPKECESLNFSFPNRENHQNKSEHLLELLQEGLNISFTHKLFEDLTKEHLMWIRKYDYILVVDEELDMIAQYKGTYREDDILSLEKKRHVFVDENDFGRVSWMWDDIEKETVYAKLKNMCDLGMLYCAKRSRNMMVTHLPVELLQSAKRTILLTYLFKGSVMESFLNLRSIKTKDFVDVKPERNPEEIKEKAKELVNIKTTPSIQKMKKGGFNLTHHWYSRSARLEELEFVGKTLRSIVNNKGYKGKGYMYTMPKANTERRVKSKKNLRCAVDKRVPVERHWLYSSARATNDYADKEVCIHLYNRYMNVAVKSYLSDYGQFPDEDQYALSEMVQWIWRSAIRNNKPIDVYIGSKRMETIFRNWLYFEGE